jgi:CheY-like chemotaxis protein
VRQLTGLLDDLLDVSSIARGKLELRRRVVPLGQLVEAAVAAAEARLRDAGQRLAVSLPERPLHVDGDPQRLVQVVTNLLVNASKYSGADTAVRLAAREEGGMAVVEVADEGVGIAADMLERIFEPFVQVSRADGRPLAGGLGIGLTLVRQLVELHGGTVEATSGGPGRGSTFTVRVPLAAVVPGAVAPPSRGAAAEAGVEVPQRVLVVDDNRDAAEALTELLALSGCRVEAAGSGSEALARADDGAFDVVLLDLDLPDLTGYEVAEQLRRLHDSHPPLIVAVSGFGHEQARQRSRDSGIDHHLVKPVDLAQLLALIAERARETVEARGDAGAARGSAGRRPGAR